MARDKERAVNPAQQQRKLDKAKALKKSKAELQARRNEKLAHRNPDRLQRQIDDLKALETSGDIKPRERQILDGLQRDVQAIRKARESLGDKAPRFESRDPPGGQQRNSDARVLGKRSHDGRPRRQYGEHRQGRGEESSGGETDESVRAIPMPRDTPPPAPRRPMHHAARNANAEPLGGDGNRLRRPHDLPDKPPSAGVTKTTYESAPQLRDLKREAISRFMPDVVRRKKEAVRGVGGLVEPEEMDRLEAEGYVGRKRTTVNEQNDRTNGRDEDEVRRLAEEEERFQRELRMDVDEEGAGAGLGTAGQRKTGDPDRATPRASLQVQIEDVEDEDI